MHVSSLAALVSLPDLSSDSAQLVVMFVALVTFVIGARGVLAWRGLAARAAGARARRRRMESVEAGLHADFDRLRGQVQELNVNAEHALWTLARLDKRLAVTRTRLAGERASLEQLSRDNGKAMRATFGRIRGTLTVLRGVHDLRRTILG